MLLTYKPSAFTKMRAERQKVAERKERAEIQARHDAMYPDGYTGFKAGATVNFKRARPMRAVWTEPDEPVPVTESTVRTVLWAAGEDNV